MICRWLDRHRIHMIHVLDGRIRLQDVFGQLEGNVVDELVDGGGGSATGPDGLDGAAEIGQGVTPGKHPDLFGMSRLFVRRYGRPAGRAAFIISDRTGEDQLGKSAR
jgi:hypothetical protein